MEREERDVDTEQGPDDGDLDLVKGG